jgi:Cu2+-containing amine oxidase
MRAYLARRGCWLGLTSAAIGFGALVGIAPPASAEDEFEIRQYFPVAKPGAPQRQIRTGWRLRYAIVSPETQLGCSSKLSFGFASNPPPRYGCGEVLELRDVEFIRGYESPQHEDRIKILNRLSLGELVVFYNDGKSQWDISNVNSKLVEPKPSFAAGNMEGPTSPRIATDIVDDHVRWAEERPADMRRGQALDIWTTLVADRYRYIIRYSFCDDGTIRVRVGATGQNQRRGDVGDQRLIHIHLPVWRMEFDLGDADANMIEVVERDTNASSGITQMRRKILTREGAEEWKAAQFTTLMVTNNHSLNRHLPPLPIGYKLVPMRFGSFRTGRFQMKSDFWVTRLNPERGVDLAGEYRFTFLDEYLRRSESIEGHASAIWLSVPFQHIPRTEDFGRDGYDVSKGATLTMWSGFDLVPHHLWDKTPLYPD